MDEERAEEVKEVVEILKEKIANKESPEVLWLSFRLLEVESKRIRIEKKLDQLLPLISAVTPSFGGII